MPSYQLAISNIAWQKDDDETVYAAMQQAGFTGLELAPTRIFSEAPLTLPTPSTCWTTRHRRSSLPTA